MENNTNIPDELNPQYLFNGTYTELLVQIATGQVDAKEALSVRSMLRNER